MWLLYLLGFRCVLSSVTWLFLSDNVVAVPVGVQVCSVQCYLAVLSHNVVAVPVGVQVCSAQCYLVVFI